MTRVEWGVDEPRRKELSRLLRTGVLKDALDLLIVEGLPRGGAVPIGDAVAGSNLNARREGFYEFYHALVALPNPPEPPKAPVPEPWGHIAPKSESPTPVTTKTKRTRKKANG